MQGFARSSQIIPRHGTMQATSAVTHCSRHSSHLGFLTSVNIRAVQNELINAPAESETAWLTARDDWASARHFAAVQPWTPRYSTRAIPRGVGVRTRRPGCRCFMRAHCLDQINLRPLRGVKWCVVGRSRNPTIVGVRLRTRHGAKCLSSPVLSQGFKSVIRSVELLGGLQELYISE